MYRVSELRGLTIAATGGELGSLEDLYFDATTWQVHYIVVDTGTWLSGRRVSISPRAAQRPDLDGKRLPVSLTRAQVEGSPDVSTTPTVSRQQEIAWHRYYGYPLYWTPTELLGARPLLPAPDPGTAAVAEEMAARDIGEPNLHGAQEVRGFYIGAADGDIGHVDDFLVDVEPWAIRYVVVDTSNWWMGKHVLVAPAWMKEVSWADSKVYTDLTQDAIRNAPEWDPDAPLQRDYEGRLHEHYGRPTYWE